MKRQGETMEKIFRQGDVLIIRDDKAKPGKRLPRERGAIVLAHGEVTGHMHQLRASHCDLHELDGVDRLLIVKDKHAWLRHEEHDAIKIAPGSYRIRIQQEYNWSEKAARRVED